MDKLAWAQAEWERRWKQEAPAEVVEAIVDVAAVSLESGEKREVSSTGEPEPSVVLRCRHGHSEWTVNGRGWRTCRACRRLARPGERARAKARKAAGQADDVA